MNIKKSITTEDNELSVGDSITITKQVTSSDVENFSKISGDDNPLHLDKEHAENTLFEDRIAHGMLCSSYISTALAQLPDTIVYDEQNLSFEKPVYLDTNITVNVEVIDELENNRYILNTMVYDEDDDVVIRGNAVVLQLN